jgi:hypothetical protein
MDNDEIRKWATEWVGPRVWSSWSDADLADAVRVKWVKEGWAQGVFTGAELRAIEFAGAQGVLNGPLAFIAAVRDIVNG